MAENVGDNESEIGSVTSSQKSFLNKCPFADPESVRQALPTKSSDGVVDTESDRTEILENPISPPINRTPILSFSSPTSLDSINDDDVFRTPPENASLDSESILRFPEMKPDSNSKSPSTKTMSLSSSSSPSLPAEIVRVLETNRLSGNVRDIDSPSPSSVAAGDVRVPGKHSDVDSQSLTAIGETRVLGKRPISDFEGNTGVAKSPSPASSSGIKLTETDIPETPIPFKEIFEALLRNSGEKLTERDEKVSCVDILKQCGLKFPK
ncbi:unnamed protein product [Microthlaspi erraticum]|uniref:Uncharacterized protein n=1 Tax=Microthlaspi erraticum TaxID=1685480 RepID=A0A6D2HHD2_9BRAS|nr:unnamed protein product [Microthlaspi erraticum]